MLRSACLPLRGPIRPSSSPATLSPSRSLVFGTRLNRAASSSSLVHRLEWMKLDAANESDVYIGTSGSSSGEKLRKPRSTNLTSRGESAEFSRATLRAATRSSRTAELFAEESARKTTQQSPPSSLPASSSQLRQSLRHPFLPSSRTILPPTLSAPSGLLRSLSTSSVAGAQPKLRDNDTTLLAGLLSNNSSGSTSRSAENGDMERGQGTGSRPPRPGRGGGSRPSGRSRGGGRGATAGSVSGGAAPASVTAESGEASASGGGPATATFTSTSTSSKARFGTRHAGSDRASSPGRRRMRQSGKDVRSSGALGMEGKGRPGKRHNPVVLDGAPDASHLLPSETASEGAGGAGQAEAQAPWTEARIRETYGTPTGKWAKGATAEAAKSSLINLWTTRWEAGTPVFSWVQRASGGPAMFRAAVYGDTDRTLVGVGDGKTRSQAESLASLSALCQLFSSGKLNDSVDMAGQDGASVASESFKLPNNEKMDFDRARMFLEFYQKEYKFGAPTLEYQSQEEAAAKSRGRKRKASSSSGWGVIMSINGQMIAEARGRSKKLAERKVYLDAVKFLTESDQGLWDKYDKFEEARRLGREDLGLAPHLFFQMSDGLHSDIQGLCDDITHSTIYRNMPSPSEVVRHTADTAPLGLAVPMSPLELKMRSESISARLEEYNTSSKHETMRATRQALPVFGRQADILAKIQVNDVTVVMAQTGSGKTTQIPQILLDEWTSRGEGAKCNILCTQPRRLAATSVAARIADERGQVLGDQVGYQVRFDAKRPQPNGNITLLTTGIFLRRMQSALGEHANPASVAEMDKISHIIVDEAHERDIDTDLSLVVLKRLMEDRRKRGVPLKVILMSATIDPTLFQKYFADSNGLPAPVAEVPGRTFPVEKFYLDDVLTQIPKAAQGTLRDQVVDRYLTSEMSRDTSIFGPDTGMDLEIPSPLVALTVAHALQQSTDGHVLVFLPGWDEIKKVENAILAQPLMGQDLSNTERFTIHKLHSSIPKEEQDIIFTPAAPGVRRIVLSTNVAESSVTIPDVVYVVDAGRVKETRYDPNRRMSSLVSAWAGKSNLQQRAGRAGRHRPGVYYGLMSKLRYEALRSHQTVEMKREDLSNVVMHVKALNFGDIAPVLNATIEPPEKARIVAAIEQLQALGAMDDSEDLTSLGRILLQLPVDVATGKLVLYGSFFRCLEPALTLAAVTSARDPFLSPMTAREAARAAKDSWSPRAFRSDPLAVVAAYRQWADLDDRGRWHEATAFCVQNFLSKPTMMQIKQLRSQILDSLDKAGVLEISSGRDGLQTENVWRSYNRRSGLMGRVPENLNENGGSLPLLAALLAMANAPNFAVRTTEHTLRTRQDKSVSIAMSSVNSPKREQGGPTIASNSFHPGERRLYAFAEKASVVNVGMSETAALNAPKTLRGVTRLDPMTYLLFGALKLVATEMPIKGMVADSWLPVRGQQRQLDSLSRLRELMDGCMLRVFEGLVKTLGMSRHERERFRLQRPGGVARGVGADAEDDDKDGLRGEREDEDEDVLEEGQGEVGGTGSKRYQGPLSRDEVKELELLTMDVVRVLDCYALEREGADQSGYSTPGGPQRGGYQSGYSTPGGPQRGGYGLGSSNYGDIDYD